MTATASGRRTRRSCSRSLADTTPGIVFLLNLPFLYLVMLSAGRNTNADSCKAACANLEDTTITSAGITNGNVCLCGRDTSGNAIWSRNFYLHTNN